MSSDNVWYGYGPGQRKTRRESEEEEFGARPPEFSKLLHHDPLYEILCEMRTGEAEAAGPDGVRPCDLSVSECGEIARQLADAAIQDCLRPGPTRIVEQPKSDGSYRQIEIANVPDRAVSRRLGHRLSDWADNRMAVSVHGWRPHRGVWTLLAELDRAVSSGHMQLLQDDIRTMFDAANLDATAASIKRHFGDGTKLAEFIEMWMRGYPDQRRTAGVRQGCAMSPLLMNLLLTDWLDHRGAEGHSVTYLRYADNLFWLGFQERDVSDARNQAAEVLHEIGFELKGEEMSAVDLRHAATAKPVVLGFEMSVENDRLNLSVPLAAWERLRQSFVAILGHDNVAALQGDIATGFAAAYAPAARDSEEILHRIARIAQQSGHHELDLHRTSQTLHMGHEKWHAMISRCAETAR